MRHLTGIRSPYTPAARNSSHEIALPFPMGYTNYDDMRDLLQQTSQVAEPERVSFLHH